MKHTEREEEAVCLLLMGKSNLEIAQRMKVSVGRVKKILGILYLKHGIDDPSKISRIVLAVKVYKERNP